MTGRVQAACVILVVPTKFTGVTAQAGRPVPVGGEPDLVHGLKVTFIPLKIVRVKIIVADSTAFGRGLPLEFGHPVVTVLAAEALVAGMVKVHGQIPVTVTRDMVDFKPVIRGIE
jgi:hypothetical protein